jgi:hypothetical protein
MAHQEIGIWEIQEVFRRLARGERKQVVQRATGHSHASHQLHIRDDLDQRRSVVSDAG